MNYWNTDRGIRTIERGIAESAKLHTAIYSLASRATEPRDLFAAHAMQALLMGELPSPAKELALDAYHIADAMMKARVKQ